MSEDASAKFAEDAKEYILLKEKIAQIAANAREQKGEIKDRAASLEDEIKGFLIESDVDICVVGDYNLKVATTKKRGAFNRKTVKEALVQFFNDAEEADKIMEHIETVIGEEEVKVLRKTKRRAVAGKEDDGPPEVDESD